MEVLTQSPSPRVMGQKTEKRSTKQLPSNVIITTVTFWLCKIFMNTGYLLLWMLQKKKLVTTLRIRRKLQRSLANCLSVRKPVKTQHINASPILLILLNHFYNSEMEVNNDAWGYVFRLLSFIVDFFFR